MSLIHNFQHLNEVAEPIPRLYKEFIVCQAVSNPITCHCVIK